MIPERGNGTGFGFLAGLKASASGKPHVLDCMLLHSPTEMSVASTFHNPLMKVPDLLTQLQTHLSTCHSLHPECATPAHSVAGFTALLAAPLGVLRGIRNMRCSEGQPLPVPALYCLYPSSLGHQKVLCPQVISGLEGPVTHFIGMGW